jgi:hypothetical protein
MGYRLRLDAPSACRYNQPAQFVNQRSNFIARAIVIKEKDNAPTSKAQTLEEPPRYAPRARCSAGTQPDRLLELRLHAFYEGREVVEVKKEKKNAS